MLKDKYLYESIDKINKKYSKKDLTIFYTRLGKNFTTLYEKYSKLYKENSLFVDRLEELIISLADMYVERSNELKELDRERELDNNWYMSQNWVGTMLYVDRYNKDLKGFKEKINYLEELGINYVHLMPILKMPKKENDGGYAVSDYRVVDEKFGTMDDIRDISKTFREKNMLLELDLVLNHTSDEHEWAKKALSGEKEYQDMYYMFDDRVIPDEFEKTLPEVFPQTAPGNFTYRKEIDKWVFTVFNNYQWDLNYTNPKVFIEMVKIMLNLANQGVDILRLDAVAFMWKKIGTDSQNLEEAHIILQLYKVCAKIVAPGVVFKAEAIVQPKEIVKYLGGGIVDECEIAYNASYMVYLWDAMATQNKKILERGLENIPRIPKNTTWVNYIRCHDDIGLGYADHDIISAGYSPFDHKQFIISFYVGEFPSSYAKGERFMYNPKTKDARISGATASLLGLEKGILEKNRDLIDKAVKRIILMHSGIMSLGGIPLVYYGDEVGFTNDYSFLNDEGKKNDNRWLNRPIINWNKVENRKKEGTIENKIFIAIQKMIKIRKNLKEFYNENNYTIIKNENEHVFSFLREYQGEKTLVLMNVSEHYQVVSQEILNRANLGYRVYNIYNGNEINLEHGLIKLDPYEFLWLKFVK
ncbi:amylosucrase [Hypnocyclicus thermotrophus]|uniref:Amylosucrase n=1 Tax=Hypnocyclicus thermotrophus TaxID=1627895 RepID=A0AA46E0L5_9FUSO|nr:alpha-amylase family glycosyl hydrolase [Hypnocyclicus thermotrophus]TDT72575.1 amylosucrase [Hypnocyclicus thermotrophus]